ncbi:hypothetical protein TrVE_jg10772 [Triparma verrucosa]|uniref:Uncharacterized protein n=1 Tax=Triparma verrucosa TaxID=1606542 RepID=A0A9W7EWX3_9STRA|nr:hypothetical protein TrVE_jg10772 [Triparma verrucosa]
MFGVLKRQHTTLKQKHMNGYKSYKPFDPAPFHSSFSELIECCSREDPPPPPVMVEVLDQASSEGLVPADLEGVSLTDLKALFPERSPALLLKLRKFLHSVPPPPPHSYRLDPKSRFFGQLLMQDASSLGNNRLAFWLEVSLLMATLLFSTSMTVAVEQPASSCQNPDMSEVACERLLKADQIMWTTISLVMVIGTFMLWTMTLVVILMSEEEVEKFVRSHVRYCSWGILITVTGIILFVPGITIRVVINSTFTTPAIYTIVLGTVSFCAMICFTISFSVAMTDESIIKFLPFFFGGFGLLPGSNVLKEPIIEGVEGEGGAKEVGEGKMKANMNMSMNMGSAKIADKKW